MKIAFFGESPADQAALAVFTEGILGEPPEVVDMGLEGHGVTGVLNVLAGVIRGVYYNSDADPTGFGLMADEIRSWKDEEGTGNPRQPLV